MTATKLVIGNWKMNGSTAQVRAFGELVRRGWPACEAALCVPHPLLSAAQTVFGATPLRWGAQDCSADDDGAFTGDVSAGMLREFGARYVILGHSERRAVHGETDGQIAAKVQRAVAAGLTPVVCIGETAEERDGEQTAAVLRRQLLQLVRTLGSDMASIVVAYEPVWAIGSGDTAAPGIIDHTHGFIAATLAFHVGLSAGTVRILYGGSVNSRNAGAILSCKTVAGVLVGGAALNPAEFTEICKAAARCSAEETSEAA
ncbi:triose-phosphate isomerase [Piscinibacter sp.]|uniref:triose-phosphate isomerase n=1 Tax=Piscinibacter sp. TaxID=1903157 RepID=UPI002BAD8FE0|nr:triose-phosphate isomerase [Albitalea sp.]HUG23109.1 triose-phosphate isomerase [Albitalea sp.]